MRKTDEVLVASHIIGIINTIMEVSICTELDGLGGQTCDIWSSKPSFKEQNKPVWREYLVVISLKSWR